MTTKQSQTQPSSRKACFDAFFDFYFPRLHGWFLARTDDRRSAEALTERTLERAVERFDRGEVPAQAAWVLNLARQALATRPPRGRRSAGRR